METASEKSQIERPESKPIQQQTTSYDPSTQHWRPQELQNFSPKYSAIDIQFLCEAANPIAYSTADKFLESLQVSELK